MIEQNSWEARFWPRVRVLGPNDCWPWVGANTRGYGMMSIGGRNRRVTQLSWELANGKPFPAGMMACHSCDNPPCVNPTHIWPGTMKDNILDARAKGRSVSPGELGVPNFNQVKTHCKRGHPLIGENLTFHTSGRRRKCITCSRQHDRDRRAKKRDIRNANGTNYALSQADVDQIVMLAKEGCANPVIAERVDRHINTVKRVLKRAADNAEDGDK